MGSDEDKASGGAMQASGRRPTGRTAPLLSEDAFEIGARIGAGATGDVFRARDLRVDRPVALKVLRSADAHWNQRLAREADAQSRIDHPHVCRVHGVGTMRDGRAFLAMQVVEGKSLAVLAPKLTLRDRVVLVAQVASGLEAAHGRGLVHRDVKPHNVLVERLTGAWHAYLVDFGLARDVEVEGKPVAAGTPEYMAPEQARGENVDARTDVYGLGATLYEMVCGRTPFAGATAAHVLSRVVSDEPVAPRTVAPGVPEDLELVVLRCLEKNPARRYPTMTELREDLLRFLAGEPVEAKAPSVVRRLARKTRRHRLALTSGALAVITVIGSVSFLARAHQRATAAANLLERLDRKIERIELVLRQGSYRPLHDVGEERRYVRHELEGLEGELSAVPPLAEASARLALGRGYLALGDVEQARSHLERAWALGERSPAMHFTFGRALSESASGDPGRARSLLAGGASFADDLGGQWPAYVAFQSGRLPEANRLAEEALLRHGTLFEASRLRGDVFVRLASQPDVLPTERVDGLKRGAAAYEETLRTAPSDPSALASLCAVRADLVTLRAQDDGDGTDSTARAEEACARAALANPSAPRVRERLTWLRSLRAPLPKGGTAGPAGGGQ